MLKPKLTTVIAVSAVSGAALTAGIIVLVVRHKRKKKRKQFLSDKKRKAITEVIELAADEVMPNGVVASSLFHHHVEKLPDKKLLALYAAAKAGEYIRDSGIDPKQLTVEQIERVKDSFNAAQLKGEGNREEVLKALLAQNFEELKPLLAGTLKALATA